MTRWERRPTAAELGLEVTIGIVARSVPDSYFVAVADQMLSYADIFPATRGGCAEDHKDRRRMARFVCRKLLLRSKA